MDALRRRGSSRFSPTETLRADLARILDEQDEGIPGTDAEIDARMRNALRNDTMFRNQVCARVVIAAGAAGYNTERPHSALDDQTPADYAQTLTTAIARPAARDDSSPRRAIAEPAPISANNQRTQVGAG